MSTTMVADAVASHEQSTIGIDGVVTMIGDVVKTVARNGGSSFTLQPTLFSLTSPNPNAYIMRFMMTGKGNFRMYKHIEASCRMVEDEGKKIFVDWVLRPVDVEGGFGVFPSPTTVF